ncbi:MAG: M23 family metallopeptidase [Verrucomicrobia bacterium]|nr:M23 family metallopeptidase [Kiritimatiellia bacterium]MCO6400752.1 M23 family metallopeptidase [Verrucomicrobiota bacterium]
MRRAGVERFDPFLGAIPDLAWPTRGRSLFTDEARYIARTRVNPDYGKPGWTRDCGKRFHRGVDIAPLHVRPAGHTVRVEFSDCATGREYPSDEPACFPEDEVYAVLPGRVVECNAVEAESSLGLFVVLEHRDAQCFTLYAHLAALDVVVGSDLAAGARLGLMGQTSRIPDARNWMAIAPHVHFEVILPSGVGADPLEFLQRGLARFDLR